MSTLEETLVGGGSYMQTAPDHNMRVLTEIKGLKVKQC